MKKAEKKAPEIVRFRRPPQAAEPAELVPGAAALVLAAARSVATPAALVERALALRVVDAATLDEAAGMISVFSDHERKVDLATRDVISAAHAAWKAALRQKDLFLGDVSDAKSHLRAEASEYRAAEEARQREAEAAAAAERARLERAAADEAARKTEALERQARADAEASAKAAERRGDRALAARLRAAPVDVEVVRPDAVFVPPPPPPDADPEGLGFRDDWVAEVDSLEALVAAIAAKKGQATVACVEPATGVLNRLAKALKQHMDVPGVRAVKKKVPVEKGRR